MNAELNARVFTILSTLVEERTGLAYAQRDHSIFADKVHARMREAGFDSPLDYYYFLRYDPGSARELDALVDTLVVTETYFFREAGPLRVIVGLLAERVAAGERPRVWSAACASGEEPLTIAMLLSDAGILDKVEIVASDISLRAFERAKEIGFGSRSLRATPPDAVARFMRREGEHVRVDRRLIDAITWRKVSIVDDAGLRQLGMFDVIVCRNVFIYFSDLTILRVVQQMASMLRPNGRLLVGAAESLMRFGTTIECEERSGAFFYRRPR
jgi:chemotaxis protein methyltransferase CheR